MVSLTSPAASDHEEGEGAAGGSGPLGADTPFVGWVGAAGWPGPPSAAGHAAAAPGATASAHSPLPGASRPGTPQQQTAGGGGAAAGGATASTAPRIVCLRKTPKSVSFQTQPAISASFPVRRGSLVVAPERRSPAVPAPSPASTAAASSAATAPEHRPRPVRSAPLAASGRRPSLGGAPQMKAGGDAKRVPPPAATTPAPAIKPAYTREDKSKAEKTEEKDENANSTAKKEAVGDVLQNAPSESKETSPATAPPAPTAPPPAAVPALTPPAAAPASVPEPALHTAKERECWQLYRRMCDKGVAVSFDTVLRGMLTPTEYRLRHSAAPSPC